jgi:hypothetical protein
MRGALRRPPFTVDTHFGIRGKNLLVAARVVMNECETEKRDGVNGKQRPCAKKLYSTNFATSLSLLPTGHFVCCLPLLMTVLQTPSVWNAWSC